MKAGEVQKEEGEGEQAGEEEEEIQASAAGKGKQCKAADSAMDDEANNQQQLVAAIASICK